MATRKSTKAAKKKGHKSDEEDSEIPLIIIEDACTSTGISDALGRSASLGEQPAKSQPLHTFSPMSTLRPLTTQRRESLIDVIRKKHADLEEIESTVDFEDLKALVHTELPSARRRRQSMYKREPGRRLTRVGEATFGWFYKTKDPNTVDNEFQQALIEDLADTIVTKDDVFVDRMSHTSRSLFRDRTSSFNKISSRQGSTISLHSRLQRRISVRESQRYSTLPEVFHQYDEVDAPVVSSFHISNALFTITRPSGSSARVRLPSFGRP